MEGEQTWPTEEDFAEAAIPPPKPAVAKRVPKGTSEYQAAWIVEDSDSDGVRVCSVLLCVWVGHCCRVVLSLKVKGTCVWQWSSEVLSVPGQRSICTCTYCETVCSLLCALEMCRL